MISSPSTVAPEEFGKFCLTERVGSGGMAEVFRAKRAWAEGVDKELCIKRILPPLSQDEHLRRLFIQEARIAVSLTHANIVPVYEFGIVDDYYFLAMEYVHGHTVRDIMMQCARLRRWLPLPLVLHLITEVLEGLDYAHRKRDGTGRLLNIVHRDVTPANIIASVEGEVKLLDFGIAAMEGVGRAMASVAGRGKPGYMAPEQAIGMAAEGRSDLFSVGVVLYELLTHRRLFRDRRPGDRRKDASVSPPSAVNRRLPRDLDSVVLRALASAPADRYPSAAAFRDALLDYMHSHGLRAGRAQLAGELMLLFQAPPPTDMPRRVRTWELELGHPAMLATLAHPPPRPRIGSASAETPTAGAARLGSLKRRGGLRMAGLLVAGAGLLTGAAALAYHFLR